MGLIDAGVHIPTIVAPDTVRLDTPFAVTIHTFGSSCLRPDGVDLALSASEAQVRPYVLEPTEGICTSDLRAHPQPVELRFSQPGAAVIVVLGEVWDELPGQTFGAVTKQVIVLEQ